MLSVLPVCAVWRGNAEALKVTFSFEGILTHRQCYRAVFLFLVGSVKRRRGRIGCTRFSAGFTGFGGDAEAVEALVCKTGLSGFESRRYLHFSKMLKEERPGLVS